MIMLRIPYPMGFYAKGLDGRIDDPNAGSRPVDHERRPHALADGRRQGYAPARRAHPTAAEPAGELSIAARE